MSQSHRWFCYYQELEGLFKRLNKKRYVVLKGDSLSLAAYGVLGKRNYSDIDILLPRKELSWLECNLSIYGFKKSSVSRIDQIMMLSGSHQVLPWKLKVKPLGEIAIDINFDIFWGEYEGKRIDIEEFISDCIEINIHGVNVKTLPPLKAMVQLILHHYKDMNSIFLLATRKSIRYEMFKDVYYLLKNNLDKISVDKLYAISAEYEIIPYVFYVLYYTGQVFDDNILKQYIEAFRTPEGEKLLDCYGLCSKEQKVWKFDFKTRLESNNLYELIKKDLTERDQEKIAINKRIFMGVFE